MAFHSLKNSGISCKKIGCWREGVLVLKRVDYHIERLMLYAYFNGFPCPKRVAIVVCHTFRFSSDNEFLRFVGMNMVASGKFACEQLQGNLWSPQ